MLNVSFLHYERNSSRLIQKIPFRFIISLQCVYDDVEVNGSHQSICYIIVILNVLLQQRRSFCLFNQND
ncbi:unnamed protein product [Adineta ricciae]|uniref:Uncharacterized protein n=1 Tax=Adineta ricciae TaxID=249248 RepID=A0A815MT88_ADIRI|nr:unnamed protein product [Adineta ricciae]